MNSTDILEALNGRLLEKWPERTVYINVCPKDFARPSFWLSVLKDDRKPAARFLTRRDVQVQLTLYDEVDDHYEINRSRLDDAVSACLALLRRVLSVGERKLLPALKSLPREADSACILLDFSFMESAQEDAPAAPAAESYQIAVEVNGGTIYRRSE